MKMRNYICDGVEFIEMELLNKIHAGSEMYANFGVGVYSDELFEMIYGRKPLKLYHERAKLAGYINGVDFVFKVNEVSQVGDVEFEKAPQVYVEDNSEKLYDVVYTPGTFDLLHEGHFEHLLQCRAMGKILVVGVKSDKNVLATKMKVTHQSEQERLAVMKSMKFVDYVVLVTSRNKQRANEIVRSLVGAPIDVVMLGSDCKGQELEENPEGLPFIFTERNPELAKKRSSSYYREQVGKQKKIGTNDK